jgi:hypothetical protein
MIASELQEMRECADRKKWPTSGKTAIQVQRMRIPVHQIGHEGETAPNKVPCDHSLRYWTFAAGYRVDRQRFTKSGVGLGTYIRRCNV